MTQDFVKLKRSLDDLREGFGKITQIASPPNGWEDDIVWREGKSTSQSGAKDLIITKDEINYAHGTGVVLNQIFDPRTCISLLNGDTKMPIIEYGPFTSYRIKTEGKSRSEIFSLVLKALRDEEIRRILCVPLLEEEYHLGIAAKNILGVPMVVWVMDAYAKDSKLLGELFRLADIRFVISPEMRDLYEVKFRQKFYIIPPVVPAALIKQSPESDSSHHLNAKVCVMIGNIWANSWMVNLCHVFQRTGWTLHRYGSGFGVAALSAVELLKHGIIEKGFLPQNEFIDVLKTYPFAIVLAGSADKKDENLALTLWSLPSRTPFLSATTNIPILVIGSEESCVAKFVKRFGIGLVVDYEESALLAAFKKLSDREFLTECSNNAAANAHIFSDEGLAEWIWKSAEAGIVLDDRFEKPFRKQLSNLSPYCEEAVPKSVHENFRPAYCAFRRLAKRGYQPEFFLDIGASTGKWSAMVQQIFPKARFILMDPLSEEYPQGIHYQYPQFEWIPCAVSHENGKATFCVSPTLSGSNFFHFKDAYSPREVTTVTLDTVFRQRVISGRGILRINALLSEHLVLKGADHLLKQVDMILMNLFLPSVPSGARNFYEMINQMGSLGFYYFDDMGELRCPVEGTLQRKGILFVRQTMFPKGDV